MDPYTAIGDPFVNGEADYIVDELENRNG